MVWIYPQGSLFFLGEDEEERNNATEDGYGGSNVPPKLDGFYPTESLEENKNSWTPCFIRKSTWTIFAGNFTAEDQGAAGFIDGLTNSMIVDDMLRRPLIQHPCEGIDDALRRVLPINNISVATDGKQMVNSILEGDAVVFFDGDARAITLM